MFLHTGKPLVETECPVGQFFMVQSKEVKQGGVEVVDVYGSTVDSIAQFVGSAMNVTGFDTATGHPNGEGFLVVVPTHSGFLTRSIRPLSHGSPSEFGAPDD